MLEIEKLLDDEDPRHSALVRAIGSRNKFGIAVALITVLAEPSDPLPHTVEPKAGPFDTHGAEVPRDFGTLSTAMKVTSTSHY